MLIMSAHRSLVLIWALVAMPCVAETNTWLVSKEQANCVIQNLDAYRSSDADPVVIFVKACPVVDAAEALESLQTNNTLPSVRETSIASELDDVIVFSRKELTCLDPTSIDFSGSIVELPRVPCD